MKTIYVVRDCPYCKSPRTGRLVYYNGKYPERIIREHLEYGEIVRPSALMPALNCFCENCGVEWEEYLEPVKMTEEEIELLKEHKEITDGRVKETESDAINDRLYNRKKRERFSKVKAAGAYISKEFGSMLHDATIGVFKDLVPKDRGTK